jgi:hypothetical protein
MNQMRASKQLQIGALIFPGVDQTDFTGPDLGLKNRSKGQSRQGLRQVTTNKAN